MRQLQKLRIAQLEAVKPRKNRLTRRDDNPVNALIEQKRCANATRAGAERGYKNPP